jgi:sigma-B regulation protein RsbU (phosphoserine phosphatase)
MVALGSGGPALGVVDEAAYDVQEVELTRGDVLVAYTDGLVETRGLCGLFGSQGIVAAVRSAPVLSAADLRSRILEAAAAHRAGSPLQDDVTLVVARVTG